MTLSIHPRIIYFQNIVAEHHSNLENDCSIYRVINGNFYIKVDHKTNEVYDIPRGDGTSRKDRLKIEYTGPFPTWYDYNGLLMHAQRALVDDSVNDAYRKYESGEPIHVQQDFVETKEYFTLHGMHGATRVYYGSHGYGAVEWSSSVTPYQFSTAEEAQSTLTGKYSDPPPKSLTDIVITHVKRRVTKTVETETSIIKVKS
ncbi:hypothetical protein EVB32_052 [Rhizobium phage RHph_TM39]|uniref:Uncharacterized protein n=1 Tax=Rhizobium phage RHph_TM30 TaxID=2509764 RepID=A0A7S5RFM3_9CAUD|nr:hypothetical protein PQC16_gp052 [Rhizobium phage RHph_TM30]QIG71159.1 hypothetical protein EVB93_052 [Rhizobium phage RHph_TM30]QIG77040.1 hypothetical protein EVB32_052 [Rhizobium phage RHph_TM39]QIG77639.1 hypothetical protein EVB64_052 [Rhizobium phage RHph_TM61]